MIFRIGQVELVICLCEIYSYCPYLVVFLEVLEYLLVKLIFIQFSIQCNQQYGFNFYFQVFYPYIPNYSLYPVIFSLFQESKSSQAATLSLKQTTGLGVLKNHYVLMFEKLYSLEFWEILLLRVACQFKIYYRVIVSIFMHFCNEC